MGNIDYHITTWYMQPVQEERGRKRENFYTNPDGQSNRPLMPERERETQKRMQQDKTPYKYT